jgi:hypothetical protein
MKMLDHLDQYGTFNEGPGHEIRIIGMPQTAFELKATIWATTTGLTFGLEDPNHEEILTDVQGSAFQLPYEQGPGFTVVDLTYNFPEGEYKPPAPNNDWEETTITVTIGYADSMTHIFTSPVYFHPDHGFALGEM